MLRVRQSGSTGDVDATVVQEWTNRTQGSDSFDRMEGNRGSRRASYAFHRSSSCTTRVFMPRLSGGAVRVTLDGSRTQPG